MESKLREAARALVEAQNRNGMSILQPHGAESLAAAPISLWEAVIAALAAPEEPDGRDAVQAEREQWEGHVATCMERIAERDALLAEMADAIRKVPHLPSAGPRGDFSCSSCARIGPLLAHYEKMTGPGATEDRPVADVAAPTRGPVDAPDGGGAPGPSLFRGAKFCGCPQGPCNHPPVGNRAGGAAVRVGSPAGSDTASGPLLNQEPGATRRCDDTMGVKGCGYPRPPILVEVRARDGGYIPAEFLRAVLAGPGHAGHGEGGCGPPPPPGGSTPPPAATKPRDPLALALAARLRAEGLLDDDDESEVVCADTVEAFLPAPAAPGAAHVALWEDNARLRAALAERDAEIARLKAKPPDENELFALRRCEEYRKEIAERDALLAQVVDALLSCHTSLDLETNDVIRRPASVVSALRRGQMALDECYSLRRREAGGGEESRRGP